MRAAEKTDFQRRVIHYREFSALMKGSAVWSGGNASQLVVVSSPRERRMNHLRNMLVSHCHFVRTTSPLDGKSLWMELLPMGVSKAAGIRSLSALLGFTPDECVAIGNDYNDVDMLRAVGKPRVTPDAPEELLAEFPVLPARSPGILADAITAMDSVQAAESQSREEGDMPQSLR